MPNYTSMTGVTKRMIAGMPMKNQTKIIGAATCQTITPDRMMIAKRRSAVMIGCNIGFDPLLIASDKEP